MSRIQNIGSTPAYISSFLKQNMDSLLEIYETGMKEHIEGCLGFKCSEKDNKMDVFFMNKEVMCSNVSLESWEQLKLSMEHKKLFFINDIDKNAVFLVYI